MSPRKRKSKKDPPSETTTAVADAPAETATAVAELPETDAPVDTAITVAEAPVTEARTDGQSFADRSGQRQWAPPSDPFTLGTDSLAGVRLFESKLDRQMAIKFGEGRFEDKPSPEVIGKLKEAGYLWNPVEKIWAHPVRFDSRQSTRIEAEMLYREVCKMIRQEKGLDPGQDIFR